MIEQGVGLERKEGLGKVDLHIVEKAITLGGKTAETSFGSNEVTLGDGLTIEQLALKNPGVFGSEVFKRIEGTVDVYGEKVPISSPKIKPGMVFFDGNLRPDERFITTRTGKRMPFNEGDKNIVLPKLPGK